MLHSFPRRQHRGRSMNSTRGFGFTVKCRNRLTTSRSVRMPDCAGPAHGDKSSNVRAQAAEGSFLDYMGSKLAAKSGSNPCDTSKERWGQTSEQGLL